MVYIIALLRQNGMHLLKVRSKPVLDNTTKKFIRYKNLNLVVYTNHLGDMHSILKEDSQLTTEEAEDIVRNYWVMNSDGINLDSVIKGITSKYSD